jgi:oligoendopeptidase F
MKVETMTDNETSRSGSEFPRRYVATDDDFGTWPTAEKYYRELAERPIESAEQFEKWMYDFSEADAIFDEQGIARRIEVTRATDDPERERRYLDFVENVQPHREPWHDKLRRKFVEKAREFPLPRKRYEVLERSIRNSIELFREANIPLEVEHAKLIQEYEKITGAMTVEYDGQEMTLQQLDRFLEEPERAVREETLRLGSERFLKDAAALDELYDRMVRLRDRMARNADCKDYREYAFRMLERFDYSPEDCLEFHDAIEQVVLPAVRQLAEQRQRTLGVATLRPWDLAVDPDNRPPLRPFETVERLKQGCSAVFHKVDPELGRIFDTLRKRDLLDLDSRKG